jgi:hypothetical protein
MTDKAWKRAERRVAEMFGGTRVPITGRARGSAPDVAHPLYSFEVKYYGSKPIPQYLKDAMSQARASVRGDQWPVVILVEKGGEMLAVVDPQDLIDWHGR